jgi:hypothetical protein
MLQVRARLFAPAAAVAHIMAFFMARISESLT